MLAFVKSPGTKPGDLDGYRFSWTENLPQYESVLVFDTLSGTYAKQPRLSVI